MTKLNITKVRTAGLGKHHDGNGLYFVVQKDGSRRWVQRGTLNGKRKEWGLGAASAIGLADVREKASDFRKQIRAGVDPSVDQKRKEATLSKIATFKEVAEIVFQQRRPSWKNPKHAQQWINSLNTYVFPKLGDVPINEISSPDVHDVLDTIWLKIPETARRIRQRISVIIDYAVAKGWREHPISMTAVSSGLTDQPRKDSHHAALPHEEIPDFFSSMHTKLKSSEVVLKALEFLILTAARTQEVRLAVWDEIDFDKNLWVIPADRMKMQRKHIVPLSPRCVEILMNIEPCEGDELIFKGIKNGRPLSDMSLLMPIKRAELGITVHGFRSSFRDWCAEETNFSREVAEMALAHSIGNKTEAAYRRGDLLKKRTELMALWSNYCLGHEPEKTEMPE